MAYRFEATTVGGFLQQLAVCYVDRGYWFYVTGYIPEDKDPACIDRKLISLYGIDISKWARARRKRAGMASVQYLRHQRFFILLATHGRHRFFEREGANIRDVRRSPIRFGPYSVSCFEGRQQVRIEREEYLRRKAYFIDIACRQSASSIETELRALPFEIYAPVRRQYRSLIRAINDARSAAGLSRISRIDQRLKRRKHRPFEPVEVEQKESLTIETG